MRLVPWCYACRAQPYSWGAQALFSDISHMLSMAVRSVGLAPGSQGGPRVKGHIPGGLQPRSEPAVGATPPWLQEEGGRAGVRGMCEVATHPWYCVHLQVQLQLGGPGLGGRLVKTSVKLGDAG